MYKMAFTLTLYTSNSDPKQVTKSLTVIANGITIRPTASINILAPSLIIDYNASYVNANYCYIPALSRYYFIDSVDLEIGKQIIFNCRVDVLMSYADQIRQCTACVVRSESIGRPTEIVDSRLPIDPNERYFKIMSWNAPDDYPFANVPTYPYLLETL